MRELTTLSKALSGMDEADRNAVLLEVQEVWRTPPMMQFSLPGKDDFGIYPKTSGVTRPDGSMDFSIVEKMLATGQIAYPLALKKAPITSIVRSPSGFSVKCADERMGELILANMQQLLKKRIDEILTMFEYGAYYGEVNYTIGWPQDYGLPRSRVPYWVIGDFNGCHPTTIEKIIRDEKTKEFMGFIQMPPEATSFDGIEIGTERALIIPNNGLFGKLEGTSILEPVHVWWFWYELVWRAFLRFLQRQGTGVVVTKAPSKGRVEIAGRYVDNMQWALQMASSLHRTNYAALPSDCDADSGKELWAIDYLKMGQDEGRQFIQAIELLGDNIKNFLLTGNTLSADEAETEVMIDAERTLSHIAMYLNNYVLPKYLMWNGSSTRIASIDFQGANTRVLPLIFKLLAVAGNTIGDALQNVDWRTLMAEGGVPVLTEEEVEELKKRLEDEAIRKQERFQEVQNKNQEEKAKMPQGGEGKWASIRDKEGKSESLEMIAEALKTPIIALTAPQVAEIEAMGIRADPGIIVLANPYHDKIGQFTDKAHASKPMPEGTVNKHGVVTDRTIFLVQDAASLASERVKEKPKQIHIYGNRASYISGVCAGSNLVACTKNTPKTYAVYKDNTIHVGPKTFAAIKKDRKQGEYILTHETLHGTKRADGSNEPDLSFDANPESYKHALARHRIEEATTDLLARKLNNMTHKDAFYMPQMGGIAILVGILADWNQAEAWKLIELMHYNINNDEYIYGLLEDAFGTPKSGWDGSSYFALLQSLQKHAKGGNYQELGWLFSDMEKI